MLDDDSALVSYLTNFCHGWSEVPMLWPGLLEPFQLPCPLHLSGGAEEVGTFIFTCQQRQGQGLRWSSWSRQRWHLKSCMSSSFWASCSCTAHTPAPAPPTPLFHAHLRRAWRCRLFPSLLTVPEVQPSWGPGDTTAQASSPTAHLFFVVIYTREVSTKILADFGSPPLYTSDFHMSIFYLLPSF